MRADSSGVNTPVSQNTSHQPARRSAATAGIISSMTRSTYASRRAAELDRHLVRAEEGRDDVEGVLAGEPRDRAQDLQLRFDGQPVPALDLARRRAAREHLVEPDARLRDERVLGRGARGRHRRDDPAARCGDLRVGRPGQPPAQLLAPIAREHRVRVRVDEARHDRVSAGVDRRAFGSGSTRVAGRLTARRRRSSPRATRPRRRRRRRARPGRRRGGAPVRRR